MEKSKFRKVECLDIVLNVEIMDILKSDYYSLPKECWSEYGFNGAEYIRACNCAHVCEWDPRVKRDICVICSKRSWFYW